MKAFCYISSQSKTLCLVSVLREDGILDTFEVKKGIKEAEKFVKNYPPKGCEVVWLGNDPWSNKEFVQAALEYEGKYYCEFEGRT